MKKVTYFVSANGNLNVVHEDIGRMTDKDTQRDFWDSSEKESPSNFLVNVDKAGRIDYPSGVKLVYPELEMSGLSNYDVRDLLLWRHSGQDEGIVTGLEIYKYLQEKKMLHIFLGWRDGLLLKEKGIKIFEKDVDAYVLWKSISRIKSGELCVPCLYKRKAPESFVDIQWFLLEKNFSRSSPGLRF